MMIVTTSGEGERLLPEKMAKMETLLEEAVVQVILRSCFYDLQADNYL